MNYKLVRHGKFSTEELNSLYKLFEEEENIKTDEKLKRYARANKFKIADIGTITTADFDRMVNNYDFMVSTDKNGRIVAYLCFEQVEIKRMSAEDSTTLFDVVHMYIANHQNHTRLDYIMFSLMENIVDKCVIHVKNPYRYCHRLNGYIPIGSMFNNEYKGCIKTKNDYKLPFYVDSSFRMRLHTIYTIVKNTGNLE